MTREVMDFPETVEEFMEEHKMVDTKEVYSNGIEYVPIFRMKQWFEHQMSVEQYRQRMIQAFHETGCEELDEYVDLVKQFYPKLADEGIIDRTFKRDEKL